MSKTGEANQGPEKRDATFSFIAVTDLAYSKTSWSTTSKRCRQIEPGQQFMLIEIFTQNSTCRMEIEIRLKKYNKLLKKAELEINKSIKEFTN